MLSPFPVAIALLVVFLVLAGGGFALFPARARRWWLAGLAGTGLLCLAGVGMWFLEEPTLRPPRAACLPSWTDSRAMRGAGSRCGGVARNRDGVTYAWTVRTRAQLTVKVTPARGSVIMGRHRWPIRRSAAGPGER